MVAAAHSAVVYIGGTSTAFTGEAMSLFSGANPDGVYQIDAAAKRMWNPSVAVTVYDGVTELTEGTEFEVESYLYGRIRLLNYTPSGAVTSNGEYLPLLEVDRASAYSLSYDAGLVEVPRLNSQPQRRLPGVQDVTFTLSRWEFGGHDYDSGAGSKRMFDLAVAGTTIYIDFNFGTGGGGARLACLIGSDNYRSAVNDPVSAELSGFVAAVKAGADFSLSDVAAP